MEIFLELIQFLSCIFPNYFLTTEAEDRWKGSKWKRWIMNWVIHFEEVFLNNWCGKLKIVSGDVWQTFLGKEGEACTYNSADHTVTPLSQRLKLWIPNFLFHLILNQKCSSTQKLKNERKKSIFLTQLILLHLIFCLFNKFDNMGFNKHGSQTFSKKSLYGQIMQIRIDFGFSFFESEQI